MIDFAAFTRARGEKAASAVPPLAELAAEESPALDVVTGGDCPRCHRPHGDDDRHCQHCGAPLRRACGKCDRPLRDDQAYCPACGVAAPQLQLLDDERAGELGAAPPLHAPPAVAEWTADDCFVVGSAVDLALVRMDAELLDDEARDRINTRAAAVANKHFRVGGRWKEEIQLGLAIAGALFPAAYIHFVIVPDEKRQARKLAAESAEVQR